MSGDSVGGAGHRLEDRVAVVTGATRGIGRAIALELARCGVRVHAVARDRAALEELAAACEDVVTHPADLLDGAALNELIARLRKEVPTVDILIHSAGVTKHATTGGADLTDLDLMLAVNLRGAYALTQGLLPDLIQNCGDVAFVNSSTTQFPRAHSGQYAATQHALIGFANSLREELNPLGVRVLTVYPGKTATALQERLHREAGEPFLPQFMLQPEDIAEILVGAIALHRRAEVTEIRIRPAFKG